MRDARCGGVARGCVALSAAVLALALVIPVAAHAAAPFPPFEEQPGPSSFEDYHRRVDEAHRYAVRALPSAWKDARASQDLAAQLNTLLPGTERVEIDGVVVTTDNSILRSYVARLDDDKAAPAARRETMEDVERHLGSLELAVDEAAGELRPIDPALLPRLLAREDLASRPTLADFIARQIARLSEWIAGWLERVRQGPSVARAGDVVLGIVLLGIAALLVGVMVFVVRTLSGMLARHDERYLAEQEGTFAVVPAAEGLPPDALAYAEELADAGRFREATRALFGGAARALVEFGLLPSTRTRTNAELLADLSPVAPPVVSPLSSLSSRFEHAWYGHADPGRDGFSSARDEYAASVRAARQARDARASGEAGAS